MADPGADERALRDWLRVYHRTPHFFGHLLAYWLRRLLRLHCLVLVAGSLDDYQGITTMRCQKCGRWAWFRIEGETMTAGVETGCPLTDRLANLNQRRMEMEMEEDACDG